MHNEDYLQPVNIYIVVFREDIVNPPNEAKTDSTRLHGRLSFYARLTHACNTDPPAERTVISSTSVSSSGSQLFVG